MPVISVKHENNKPGYACFHVGERRDKRWSCRSSSGGEPGSVFDRRRRRDDSPRRRSAATRGPARPQNDDRLRFYCSHAQRSVAVPTTATIMSVVAAVPARRVDSTKRGRGHAPSWAGSGGRNFASAAATVRPNAVLYQWRSVLGGAQGPDSQNILRQSYDYLTIMPKLRPTYVGRLIYKTFYNEWKAFHR